MTKIWKFLPGDCDSCGGDTEILTNEEFEEGMAYDGDEVRCVDCEAKGHWSVFAEDDAYVNWYE